MADIEFTIPGEPASKARARFTHIGSKVRTYTPAKTKTAENAVAAAYLALAAPGTDPETAYAVTAEFLHETGQRRDIDNMLKLVLDGLNKIAWPDDVQVVSITAVKRRVPKGEALTRVRIAELGRIEKPRGRCLQCGGEFAQYTSTASRKFCSRPCGYAHRVAQRERACLECGKPFLAWGETRETRFCSRACNSADKRVDLICVACGQGFTKPRSLANQGVVACSEDCRAAYHRAKRPVVPKGICVDCAGPTSTKRAKRCRSCFLYGPDNRVTVTIEEIE